MTTQPIATNQVLSVQVLHALMRTCDFFMKVAVHLSAAVYEWTESTSIRHYPFLKRAKSNRQSILKEKTGIRWDFVDSAGNSGTSTTGPICRRILHNPDVRKLVTDEIPVAHRSTMEVLGQRLSIILRVMASKEVVHVEEFNIFCIETNIFLL